MCPQRPLTTWHKAPAIAPGPAPAVLSTVAPPPAAPAARGHQPAPHGAPGTHAPPTAVRPTAPADASAGALDAAARLLLLHVDAALSVQVDRLQAIQREKKRPL